MEVFVCDTIVMMMDVIMDVWWLWLGVEFEDSCVRVVFGVLVYIVGVLVGLIDFY